jgi:hypothetical protein
MAACPQCGQVMTAIKTMRGLLLDGLGRREAAFGHGNPTRLVFGEQLGDGSS